MTRVQQTALRSGAFERSLKLFEENRDRYVEDHYGQFVLIHDGRVVGFYDREMEGYYAGKEQFGLGEFLLKKCIERDEDLELRFHSRIA